MEFQVGIRVSGRINGLEGRVATDEFSPAFQGWELHRQFKFVA